MNIIIGEILYKTIVVKIIDKDYWLAKFSGGSKSTHFLII